MIQVIRQGLACMGLDPSSKKQRGLSKIGSGALPMCQQTRCRLRLRAHVPHSPLINNIILFVDVPVTAHISPPTAPPAALALALGS